MSISVFRFFSFVLVISLLSIVSCKENKGCTNPNAFNYDPDAETENGNCKSEGSVMFWIDQETFGYLFNEKSVKELNFYINGELRGSQNVNQFFTSEPNCEESFTFSGLVPHYSGLVVDYVVLDEDKEELWNGKVVIPSLQCNKLELVYIP